LKPWLARSVTYAVVGLLAAGALAFVRPLPRRGASETPVQTLTENPWREQVDSLGAGETLGEVFERGGIQGVAVHEALRAASSLDPRRVPAGMRITFGAMLTDSAPREVTLQLAIDRVLRLTRTETGWAAREDTLPWMVDTVVVKGGITSNLYDALDAAGTDFPSGARVELAWDVADIFEFRIDMSRDLQVGDQFAVLVERRQGPQGAVRTGRVLAASFINGGRTIHAIRHERDGERPRYYDQDAKSLAANFLRAPLAFRRISSVFGLRKHPILGVWRRHQGTDYAASSGTPVRSIGAGVVIFAGRRGGYGNAIDVRHANGYVSRYGHLRGFARGVRSGTRVDMGETIGYVGMTGLATAPHLHFEILVGGVHRNPRTALASKSGAPLPELERPRFDLVKAQYLAMLGGGTVARAADAGNH
jgi:murein DD-endopeptidase MepM/ murein hydrolase activator NlpD